MTTKMALTWESSVRGNGDMCGDGELGKRQTRLLWVMVTEYAVELWGHWWVRVVFGNGKIAGERWCHSGFHSENVVP